MHRPVDVITPATTYITFVIPAKAGIQGYCWMPDRACPQLDWGVRHDRIWVFSRRVNMAVQSLMFIKHA